MFKKAFCALLLVAAALIGYRVVNDVMEDSRDFR